MTEEEVFEERTRLYAHVDEELPLGTVRCLDFCVHGQRWLFPKTEVRLLLPQYHVTPLPRGVRWRGRPCPGLITHSMRTYPLLCWSLLAEQRDPVPGQEQAFLLLRVAPVALRVPVPVEMTEKRLHEAVPDQHRWSSGRLPCGSLLAHLEPLGSGEP